MALPTTSGTLQTAVWTSRQVIDHAARRAGVAAEMTSAENVQIAQECLNSILATWVSIGFPLWTRQYQLLSPAIGSPDVPCSYGTMDVLDVYWRQFAPWRGAATLTSGSDGSILCAGAPNADVMVTSINPGIYINQGAAAEVDTIGILLGGSASITASLVVQTSSNGSTWTTSQTLPSTTFAPGTWQYFDLNPAVTAQYVRVYFPYATSTTIYLNQVLFGLAGWTDAKLGDLNIDDYYNLTNRGQQGNRANSCFVDRQISAPVIKIWNTLNAAGWYAGTVTALTRSYIQDVGAMYNAIEIPQRAVEALTWRLAATLIWEINDTKAETNPFMAQAKQAKFGLLEANAAKQEAYFWAEERSAGPINITPLIKAYTA
jgi:hypothetical protein